MKPSVTFSNTRIAWVERGQGDPVLLLHPLLFTGSIFDAIAGRIAQHGYRVVAPDLPGHGESDAPPERLDLDAMAATMAEFVSARSMERCHVVGVSLGAMVALRLAIRWPGLVRSLILMGVSARGESGWNRRRWMTMARIASLAGPGAVTRWASSVLLADSTIDGPRGPIVRSIVESTLRRMPRSRILPLMRSYIGRTLVGVEARRGIECPTLAIAGKEDRVRSARDVREAVAPIHGSALVELPLCGHLPVLEQPVPSVSLILRFLDAADHRAASVPRPRSEEPSTMMLR